MKNPLGNLGGTANNYAGLAWKYLFEKDYWIYLLVAIVLIFVFGFMARIPTNTLFK